MKKTKYLLLLLCMILVITGCKKTPKLENGKEVIVEVEGKQFTADDFFEKLKEDYGTSALVNLIDNYITEKETNDDIKKEAKTEAKSLFDQYKAYYGTNFDTYLSNSGFKNSDEFLKAIEENTEQSLVLEKYIKNDVIKEDEIKEYYEKNIYGEMTVRHILITPEVKDDMSEDEKTEAKNKALEKAKEIINELNKSNDLENDFIALAKEKSDDKGSKSEGGLIENFTNESGLVQEFFDASLKLEVGKMTAEPVETEFGYHIIYKIKQNDKPSLDQVKDKVIEKITSELLSSNNASYVYWAGLREKYNMKIYDTTINNTYTSTMNNLKKQS